MFSPAALFYLFEGKKSKSPALAPEMIKSMAIVLVGVRT